MVNEELLKLFPTLEFEVGRFYLSPVLPLPLLLVCRPSSTLQEIVDPPLLISAADLVVGVCCPAPLCKKC